MKDKSRVSAVERQTVVSLESRFDGKNFPQPLALPVLLQPEEVMNANPFQIPACFQDMQRRRRERFKKAVLVVVAGIVMLLVGLLIAGCVSEHAKAGESNRKCGQSLSAEVAISHLPFSA
ncbi:MAG TPA: hypothetical protein VK810_04100, partial [Dongiaceae bacterium]|nr:hypothetical protein [Dongiaceae bacterium]